MYRKRSVVYRGYRTLEGKEEDAKAKAAASHSAPIQPPKRKEHQKQHEEEQETTAVPKFKSKTHRGKEEKRARKAKIVIEHVDIIGDEFWEGRPWPLWSENRLMDRAGGTHGQIIYMECNNHLGIQAAVGLMWGNWLQCVEGMSGRGQPD